MKKFVLIVAIASVFTSCGNSSESAADADTASSADSDTTIHSTTPPPKKDTNPIGIMMGDTTIGINDSLKKDSLKR